MRKLFQKLHLIIGLTVGLVVFIVATTGCITSFEEELRGFMYSDLYSVKQDKGNTLKIDEIKSIAEKTYTADDIKGLRIYNDPSRSIEVQFQDRNSLFIDQYSGKVLGTLKKNDDFFGKVLRLHRNLFLDDIGEWITGISALCFFIMIISGLIIWWPTSKKNRKEKLTLKRNVHPVKRNYDLHSVLGFYASWFILFTVLTALIWSFEWAEKSMFWLSGSTKEPRMEIESAKGSDNDPTSLNSIYYKAKYEFNAQEECIISLPEEKTGSIRVILRYGNKGFFRKQDNMFFDQFSGKLIKVKRFDELNTGTKLRISNEHIHTGKAFGIVGQWAVFFASLICASLPITGFFIWRNKRKGK